jgi:hypothetical protein
MRALGAVSALVDAVPPHDRLVFFEAAASIVQRQSTHLMVLPKPAGVTQ